MIILETIELKMGEECRERARDALEKAEMATDFQAKQTWYEIAKRWTWLASTANEEQPEV